MLSVVGNALLSVVENAVCSRDFDVRSGECEMQRWMQRRRNADIGTARRGGGRERESKGRGGGRCGRHAASAGQGRGRGRESRYTSGNEEVGWPGEREPRLEGEEHRGRLAGRRRQAGGGRGGEAAVCFIGFCSVVAYRRLSGAWSRTGDCLAGGHVPAVVWRVVTYRRRTGGGCKNAVAPAVTCRSRTGGASSSSSSCPHPVSWGGAV